MQKLRMSAGAVADGSMEDAGTSGGTSFDDVRGPYRPTMAASVISHDADIENDDISGSRIDTKGAEYGRAQ